MPQTGHLPASRLIVSESRGKRSTQFRRAAPAENVLLCRVEVRRGSERSWSAVPCGACTVALLADHGRRPGAALRIMDLRILAPC